MSPLGHDWNSRELSKCGDGEVGPIGTPVCAVATPPDQVNDHGDQHHARDDQGGRQLRVRPDRGHEARSCAAAQRRSLAEPSAPYKAERPLINTPRGEAHSRQPFFIFGLDGREPSLVMLRVCCIHGGCSEEGYLMNRLLKRGVVAATAIATISTPVAPLDHPGRRAAHEGC